MRTISRISEVTIDGWNFYPAGIEHEYIGSWFEGIVARLTGKDVDRNPYTGAGLKNSRDRRAWNSGWNEADNKLRDRK